MSTAPHQPRRPTTTLLRGGRIYASTAPDATAMAIAGDTVVWVGQDSVAAALYPDADHTVDLDGAFVAPAFVDAHTHATASGVLLDGLDLTGCRSLTDCLDAVRRHTRTAKAGVVWGHGWDESSWPEGRPPTRAELDDAAGRTPLYLSRIDVHSALVTTALTDGIPEIVGSDGWSATGPITRAAHHHARRAARGTMTEPQRRQAQLSFLRHAASRGIASVHECAGPDISGEDDLRALLQLADVPDLPDVVGYWGEAGAVDTARRLGARGLAGDLFVDGSLGSRTAALRDPYTDDPSTCGANYLAAADIAEHLIACTRAGIQAGFHVIGDAAVDAVIDGFATAEHTVGAQALAGRRHRLEHLEMVTAAQAARLAAWGVGASVQPLFDANWGGPDGMYARRLGPARGTTLNPYAHLAAAGVLLALGSDSPVTPLDPWAAVQAAVYHRTTGFGVSPRAAFTAHTRAGWRIGGVNDGATGTLAAGAPATYAVWDTGELVIAVPDSRVQRWSTDPRAQVPGLPALDPGAALPRCRRTVLRGEVIYDRESDPV